MMPCHTVSLSPAVHIYYGLKANHCCKGLVLPTILTVNRTAGKKKTPSNGIWPNKAFPCVPCLKKKVKYIYISLILKRQLHFPAALPTHVHPIKDHSLQSTPAPICSLVNICMGHKRKLQPHQSTKCAGLKKKHARNAARKSTCSALHRSKTTKRCRKCHLKSFKEMYFSFSYASSMTSKYKSLHRGTIRNANTWHRVQLVRPPGMGLM